MRTVLTASIVTWLALARAAAATETFDFKDPKNMGTVSFKLVAPKETIQGSANGVSGSVTFDPDNPSAIKGKIVIAGQSLTVPNGLMKQHLHSAMWLDVAKHPEITFEIAELKNVKNENGKISGDASGTFTLKGVTKELTVPVTLDYKAGQLEKHIAGKKGDLLVVRGNFSIQRSDFNINAHQNEDKVADQIDLTIGIVGAAEK